MDKMMRKARWIVTAALVFPLAVAAAIAVDLSARASHQDRSARQWMEALDLSSPAFWPAGTLQRFPQALPPGVGLRLSPLFDWDRDGRTNPSLHRSRRQPALCP